MVQFKTAVVLAFIASTLPAEAKFRHWHTTLDVTWEPDSGRYKAQVPNATLNYRRESKKLFSFSIRWDDGAYCAGIGSLGASSNLTCGTVEAHYSMMWNGFGAPIVQWSSYSEQAAPVGTRYP